MTCTKKKCVFTKKRLLKEVFAIPLPFRQLLDFLSDKPELSDCICNIGDHEGKGTIECRERGRISWADPQYKFLHIRFDDCVCKDSRFKKCDCIIFRGGKDEPPVMFVIETKGTNPSFSEVKAQIEYCLESMMIFLPEPKNQFRVLPVLCAGRRTAFMKEACLSNKITIFGKPWPINICLYAENINQL